MQYPGDGLPSPDDAQYRQLFRNYPHPMWVLDAKTRAFLAVNRAALLQYGYSEEEFTSGTETMVLAGGEALPSTTPSEPGWSSRTVRHRRRDGSIVDVELLENRISFHGHDAVVALAMDVTERKSAQETLRMLMEVTSTASESEDTYTMTSTCLQTICALRGWNIGQAWFPHEKGASLFCSPHSFHSLISADEFRFESLNLRLPKGAGLPGRVWQTMQPMWISDLSQEGTLPRAQVAQACGLKSAFAFPIRDRDRLLAILEFFGTDIRPPGPHALDAFQRLGIHLGVVFLRKKEQETIRHQAYHDQLTGLPNRVLFRDRFEQAIARRGRREPGRMAMLFLDLDRFKTINDSLGHSVGDQLLQEVAQRVNRCLREIDTVARMGGDEFLILLPDLRKAEDAAKVAEKILSVFDYPFHLQDHDLHITTSIGVSVFPEDGQDAPTLMKNADIALYRAKDRGRNNYQMFTQAMTVAAVARLKLENGLRRCLERGEMALHFQPVINLADGKVLSIESLLRWTHPEMGQIAPADFIPVAEDTGLIMPIWAWALRSACIQSRAWQQQGLPPAPISMNISATQFQQPNFVAIVVETLRETGLPPTLLDLEITESMAMRAEYAIKVLHELRDMGVGISIDDFGIGYSSLSYVKRFPITTIKIDPHFLREITSDPGDQAIVKTIIALGHGLHRTVIAEGVETPEQVELLRQLGCDGIQGFVVCRPMPADEFTILMRQGFRLSQ